MLLNNFLNNGQTQACPFDSPRSFMSLKRAKEPFEIILSLMGVEITL
jgi:hypothetical protein